MPRHHRRVHPAGRDRRLRRHADGDGLLSFNFRSDRIREILGAVLQPDFKGFARPRRPALAKAVSMTSYSAELDR
jgi:2,3-bisphosphoglycerate-independent phosphoglycerate mutase